MNDTMPLHVKEAWIENHWVKPRGTNETFILSHYQLCINSEEADIKAMDNLTWSIGVNGDHYIRGSGINSLVGDFITLPGDTIYYDVQLGDNLSDSHKVVKIGQLVFFKKK
jgi:hypothetical protein